MAHSFTSLYYHIVYSTKRREPILSEDMRERLLAYSGGIVRTQRSSLVAASAMSDHVHLLVHGHPSTSLSDVLREIKSRTSSWATQTMTRDAFSWQNGYGAFIVSKSAVGEVERYIANQESHHRRMTFQEKFIARLENHGVKYDPRYVWGD
jgi:putative transposase